MAGPFDFLHIKSRTAGSSNELSFDVLDAASSGIDSKEKRSSKAGKAPTSRQGSYHGVAESSTLSSAPEVTRRKRARRSRSIRTGLTAVIALALIATVGVYAGMHLYQGRVDFSGRFNALVEGFIDVDQTLVRADELMVDSLNSVEADQRKDVLDAIPALDEQLDSISADALDMEPLAAGDADRSALAQVRAASDARKKMLAAAEDAFTLAVVVNKQIKVGNDAWSEVLAADNTAREATTAANSAQTEEATIAARDKTEEAIAGLEAARSDLAMLEKEASGLDLSDELAYIDKRLDALEEAVKTSDALLDNDRDAATTANDAYNRADAEAAGLAATLTISISDKVKALHADDTTRNQEAYSAARAEATTADSSIRAYLG